MELVEAQFNDRIPIFTLEELILNLSDKLEYSNYSRQLQMSSQTNSAKLLHQILKTAWGYGTTQASITVWKETLSKYNKDNADLNDNILQLHGLIHDVGNDIKSLEFDDEEERQEHLSAIHEISNFLLRNNLFDNKGNSWGNTKNQIHGRILSSINSLGTIINLQGKGKKEIPSDDLIKLQEKIRSLIDQIRDSEIHEDIKISLLSELRDIEEAILNYGIRGPAIVVNTCDKSTGSLVRLSHYFGNKISKSVSDIVDEVTKKYIRETILLIWTISNLATPYPTNFELFDSSFEFLKLPKATEEEKPEKISDAVLEDSDSSQDNIQ